MRLEKYLGESTEEVIETLKRDCGPFLKDISPRDILLYRGSNTIFMGDISKPHTPRKDRRPKDMRGWMFDLTNYAFKKVFGWEARKEGVFVVGLQKIAQRYGNPYLFFPIGKYDYIWSGNIEDLYIRRGMFDDLWDIIETKKMVKKAEKEDRNIDQIDINKFYDVYDEIIDEFIKGDEMKMYRRKANSNAGTIDLMIGSNTDYESKDFRDETMKEMKEITVKFVKRNYIENSLRTYRNNKRHEIMFNCKKYYLVQPEFTEDIMRELL